MTDKRITEDIGIFKLILTILSAIFAPFTAWLYNNFTIDADKIALVLLDLTILFTIFAVLLYLLNLSKKL